MVWLAFSLMSAAAVLCLVWPLAGTRTARGGPSADVAFYASQLAELDGDIGRGLISGDDAQASRTEISRRLLAAGRTQPGATSEPSLSGRGFRTRRIGAVLAAVVLVPAVAIGVYLRVGQPGQPDMPLASRADAPDVDLASAIVRIEAHLAMDPNDGRGFQLIAPIYLRIGRYDDAARAYEATLRLLGENAEGRAALGQALVMAADGVVTSEARAAFDKALADDPKLPQARFFQAVGAEQDGDKSRATGLLQGLLADSPADAPWLPAVREHMASLETPGGAPLARPSGPAPQMAAAPQADGSAPNLAGHADAAAGIAAMAPEQRATAIRGMVDGLAARLAQDGRDPEGWLRLIKAYTVMGEETKARAALTNARKGLDGDAPALGRIDALARQLGLEG